MFGKIRHIAMYTHNHAAVDQFYQQVFGMRRMTSNTLDETGKQNPNRGHISDGVIGMAILPRYAGMQSGMDHYGFEVADIKEFVRRMQQHYPKTLIAKGLDYVPFAGLRSYDPAGAHFDIAQAHVANVREGYNEAGWEQSRWINHISIRANDPAQAAEFYEKIFELKEAETYKDDGSICMTDGKVKLLAAPARQQPLPRPARGARPLRLQSRKFGESQKRSGGADRERAAATERKIRRRQRQEK